MPSSKEIIRLLKKDGWYEVNSEGDHFHFRHPTKPGKVTVKHPAKDLGVRLVRSIEKQIGLKLWNRQAREELP